MLTHLNTPALVHALTAPQLIARVKSSTANLTATTAARPPLAAPALAPVMPPPANRILHGEKQRLKRWVMCGHGPHAL